MPLVSVIVPTYQRASYLRRTLKCLLEQSFRDMELLIMDDGSTDETGEVVNAFQDKRIRYFRPGRLGVPKIVNAGFAESRGKYIMVCHDHDFYSKRLIETFVAMLERYPTAGFVFCAYLQFNREGTKPIALDVQPCVEMVKGNVFLSEHLMPRIDSCVCALSMARREMVGETYLDERIGACADVDLWHRLASTGDVCYVREPLIGVVARDNESEMWQIGPQLLRNVLKSKHRYLQFIGRENSQRAVIDGWRPQVDRYVASFLLRALQSRRLDLVASLVDLEKTHGTKMGGHCLWLLSKCPRAVAMRILAIVRRVWTSVAGGQRPRGGSRRKEVSEKLLLHYASELA